MSSMVMIMFAVVLAVVVVAVIAVTTIKGRPGGIDRIRAAAAEDAEAVREGDQYDPRAPGRDPDLL